MELPLLCMVCLTSSVSTGAPRFILSCSFCLEGPPIISCQDIDHSVFFIIQSQWYIFMHCKQILCNNARMVAEDHAFLRLISNSGKEATAAETKSAISKLLLRRKSFSAERLISEWLASLTWGGPCNSSRYLSPGELKLSSSLICLRFRLREQLWLCASWDFP